MLGIRFIISSLVISFLTAHETSAQKQNKQWRFVPGSAIDFNTDPPTFPTDCALPTFVPDIPEGYVEGTASIADKNTGELLFYTDGKTVWNRLNVPMPNGNFLYASGDLNFVRFDVYWDNAATMSASAASAGNMLKTTSGNSLEGNVSISLIGLTC